MNDVDKTISNSKEESLKKALEIFNENNVPNKVNRPNINIKIVILKVFFILFFELVCLIFGIYFSLKFKNIIIFVMAFILFLLIVFFKSKDLIVSSVLLYQKLASERLRSSCLFTPSCSEYMILAIDKYGTVIGVCKGIKRLLRCHSPNGGIDYP